MPVKRIASWLKGRTRGKKRPTVVRAHEGNVVTPPGEVIREIFSDGKIGVAEADVREAKLHYHKKMNEYYYVAEGKGKVRVGDQIIELNKGDFLHIPPGTPHKAFSKKGFKILVITRKPWSPKDHHLLE